MDIKYESHPFQGDRNNVNCSLCKRPMCFHKDKENDKLSNLDPKTPVIRSAWPVMVKGKALSDKKIQQYENKGFYSEDYRLARRDQMNKKQKRDGNFIEVDGRMIYRLPGY